MHTREISFEIFAKQQSIRQQRKSIMPRHMANECLGTCSFFRLLLQIFKSTSHCAKLVKAYRMRDLYALLSLRHGVNCAGQIPKGRH
jgi:hypothetical protein